MPRRRHRFAWALLIAAGCAANPPSQNGTTATPAPSASASAIAYPSASASNSPAASSSVAALPPALARPPAVQIAARGNVSCARFQGGSVRCWGDNYFNVIARDHAKLGASAIRHPRPIADLPPAAELVIGEAHACARLVDGTVRCWGTDDGDLGLGTPLPPGPPGVTDGPMPVLGLGGVTALSGYGHLCAITAGSVSCWADYDRGNGDPRDAGSRAPVIVPGWAGALQLADGGNLSCARLATQVKCWSDVSPGLIPKGKVRVDPFVVAVRDVASIAGGSGGACAITTAGGVSCWGTVPFFDTPRPLTAAAPVTALHDVVGLAMGPDLGCAVQKSGDVLCIDSSMRTPTLRKVGGLIGAVEVAVGESHACARTLAGDVRCWGKNDLGQLGDGSTTDRIDAVDVAW